MPLDTSYSFVVVLSRILYRATHATSSKFRDHAQPRPSHISDARISTRAATRTWKRSVDPIESLSLIIHAILTVAPQQHNRTRPVSRTRTTQAAYAIGLLQL